MLFRRAGSSHGASFIGGGQAGGDRAQRWQRLSGARRGLLFLEQRGAQQGARARFDLGAGGRFAQWLSMRPTSASRTSARVASLVRKYRLDERGAGAGIRGRALRVEQRVFSCATAPRGQEARGRGKLRGGCDASAGFVGLLKRNIPFNQLIETCVAEWKRSFGHKTKPRGARAGGIAAAAGE